MKLNNLALLLHALTFRNVFLYPQIENVSNHSVLIFYGGDNLGFPISVAILFAIAKLPAPFISTNDRPQHLLILSLRGGSISKSLWILSKYLLGCEASDLAESGIDVFHLSVGIRNNHTYGTLIHRAGEYTQHLLKLLSFRNTFDNILILGRAFPHRFLSFLALSDISMIFCHNFWPSL